MRNSRSLCWVLIVAAMLITTIPAAAQDENVILNPGTISGSVSVGGYNITSITVRSIDVNKEYSATVTVNIPGGASSIDYTLTVEGDKDYYVTVDATVAAPNYARALFPVSGPVNVPIGGNVPLDLSMDPAFISGNISTGSSGNTITSYSVQARVILPEFEEPTYYCYTSASGLNAPGDSGTDYTLLVAPGTEYYYVYAYITIDGLNYYFYDYNVSAPAAGDTLIRDYIINVTSAHISGFATLAGIDVTSAYMRGYATSPSRYAYFTIPVVTTGVYTLDVDEGAWRLYPYFYFNLPDDDPDLSGLTGSMQHPYSPVINVNAGDDLTFDFDVVPGFIPGTLNLWGANTNFYSGSVRAYGYLNGGYVYSEVDPETGKFLFVCPPGDWQIDNYQYLLFDYPDDPDTSLYSYVGQSYYNYEDLQSVAAGQTTSPVELTYGTITVRRYFYVAGGGILSRPYIAATKSDQSYPGAYGYGSYAPTTEGQAIVTLLLPGTYSIEAFATVDGSVTEFGTVEVTVDEGDVVVIGGSSSPVVKVTNPTNGETICGTKATIEGIATDDDGIASITINGEDVAFASTGNPDNPEEVAFSHEITLIVGEENTITIVVIDKDDSEPTVLTMNVISKNCGNPCEVTMTNPTDGATIRSDSVTVQGTVTNYVNITSITVNGEAIDFEPADNPEDPVSFSYELIGLNCGENIITIVVTDSGQTEPVVTTASIVRDCSPCIENLAARAKDGKIQLTWDNRDGASSYNIYRSTVSGGPYTLVAANVVTTYCTYLDTGLTNGTTYYYVVRPIIIDDDGSQTEYCQSGEVSATPVAGRSRPGR